MYHSNFSWSVVAKYDANELADNSDDESKIEKAERATERKAAIQCKKHRKPFVSSMCGG